MQRKDHIDAFGATALILFSLLLGLNQVLVKLVNAGFSPIFQAGLRSACAIGLIIGFAVLARRRLSVLDGSLGPGLAAGLLFSFEFFFLFTALEHTSVARASVLFYTMPVWVAVAAHFLIPGERLTWLRGAGLMLAVIGVAIALRDPTSRPGPDALVGDVMALAGALAWAGIAILARTTKLSAASPEMQLVYQLAVSAPLLLVAAPLLGPVIREVTPLILGIFAFQVIVVVCVGFLTWFWILRIYPASDMAAFSFLAPVFGVIAAWLILDETISAAIWVALVLVGTGIALVSRKRGPR